MTYRDDYRKIEREAFWSAPRILLVAVVLLVVSYFLGFLITGGDLVIYRFWAPKYANAQREVFENTQSYVQGKISYLASLRLDYESAKDEQKESLRRLIISEAAQVDNDKLPADLQRFVYDLKAGR